MTTSAIKDKRIEIDALKGVAIFLVVLGHSIIFYPINMHENVVCDFLFQWLSSVHMPLFFIVSGFCFSYNISYLDFVRKKAKRLLLPYVVFNLIDILPRSLFATLVNRPRSVKDSCYRILFYGGEYWFLYTLFIIFLLFPFIYRLFQNKYLCATAVACLMSLSFIVPNIDMFNISRVISYSVYFGLGIFIKYYWGNRIFDNWGKKMFLLPLSVLWILLICINNDSVRYITAFVGITVLFICTRFERFNGIFARFGKYSLQIYLLNGFLLVISRSVAIRYMHINNYIAIIVINMLVDFFLSYLIIDRVLSKSTFIKTIMGM